MIQVAPGFLIKSRLQKIIDRENPDVIHAHLRRSTRLLAKCKTDAVKVSTLHIGINSKQFLDMDALIAISPWQLEHVPSDFNGEVRWIRNSLTPHPQPSAERIKELKHELDVHDRHFIVGGIGRFSNSKGWDTLINAFSLADLPNSALVLIGEGREKEKLEKLALQTKKTILFEPYKHQVKDYYSTFDVFVCPSREEPMGRVVLEALDSGTRVIASNIEGPKDILSEFPGTLFAVDNTVALADALQQAYEKHVQGASKKRPDLSSHYTDKVNQDMVDLYFDVLAKKQHHV